jgi:hypothetical protein
MGATESRWMIWHVAPIALPENGHFVVDDVIYLKDEGRDVESRLSEYVDTKTETRIIMRG